MQKTLWSGRREMLDGRVIDRHHGMRLDTEHMSHEVFNYSFSLETKFTTTSTSCCLFLKNQKGSLCILGKKKTISLRAEVILPLLQRLIFFFFFFSISYFILNSKKKNPASLIFTTGTQSFVLCCSLYSQNPDWAKIMQK